MLVIAAVLAASCDPYDIEDPFSSIWEQMQPGGGMGGAQINVTPADCPIEHLHLWPETLSCFVYILKSRQVVQEDNPGIISRWETSQPK